MNVHVGVSSAGSDGEAIQSVVRLGPPAVQDGEIEAAVQDHFLTARAGRLERPPGIVQPHVDALHEVASDINVVVFDKYKFVGELFVAHQLRDLLQHSLARIVARVRLSGEHKLHRPLRIVHHQGDFFDVGQDQVSALVSSEAPCESDS